MIVIGGGDTGADCIGTSLRHGCKSLVNFELLDQPPPKRAADNPWPQWPRIYRTDYGHEEVDAKFGDDPRKYGIMTKEFVGDGNGNVAGIRINRVEWQHGRRRAEVERRRRQRENCSADLVLLAMGFLGPEPYRRADARRRARPALELPAPSTASSPPACPGVFAAGDCRRGQSLVVWAINEGRGAARAIDEFLMGASQLPAPKLTLGGTTA